MGDDYPSIPRDTHRIANALEALVELQYIRDEFNFANHTTMGAQRAMSKLVAAYDRFDMKRKQGQDANDG